MQPGVGNKVLAYLIYELLDNDNKNSWHKQLSVSPSSSPKNYCSRHQKQKHPQQHNTKSLKKETKKEANSTSTLGSGRPSCEYNLVQSCMRDMGPNAAVWGGGNKHTHRLLLHLVSLNATASSMCWLKCWYSPYSWSTPTQQWTRTWPLKVPLWFNTHICL